MFMVEQTGRMQQRQSKIKVRNFLKYTYNFTKLLVFSTVIISIIKYLGVLG